MPARLSSSSVRELTRFALCTWLGLLLAVASHAANRTVRVESRFQINDADVTAPVIFSALGDEAALSFTVAFNPQVLRQAQVIAGPGAASAIMLVNADRASEGLLGLSLAQTPGRTFPAGDLHLINLVFRADGIEWPTSLRLTDDVLPRLVADGEAELLPATFLGGQLELATRTLRIDDSFGVPNQEVELRLEGVLGGTENALSFSLSYDPAALSFLRAVPGSAGQGVMLMVNTNEMAAGRIGLVMAKPGGQVFAAGTNDLLRLRLQAATLPPSTPIEFADSPVPTTVADLNAQPLPVRLQSGFLQQASRQIRLPDRTARMGSTVITPVQVVSTGGESAFAFSLLFDPVDVLYVKAELGADALQGRPLEAQLVVNDSAAAEGRVGFLISLPPGAALPPGLREILLVSLQARRIGVVSPLAFGDQPIRREVTDTLGRPVTVQFVEATLTSLSPVGLEIVRQPVHQTANEGASVTLNVQITGIQAAFQWRKDGLDIPGATNPSLVLTNLRLDQAGSYAVVVSGPFNTLISQPAIVRVRQAPIIVTPPQDTTIASRLSASLQVTASGTEPLTYQWLKNGVPIAGANRPSLDFPSARLEDAGSYAVVVANAASPGVLSAPAQLVVIASPELRRQPQDQNTAPGQPVHFEVEATGAPPLTYQWRKNGQNLPNETNTFLFIPSVQLADAATYTVVVANTVNTVTSDPAQLIVAVTPLAPGDLFADRVTLEGTEGQIGGNNLAATRELGEPDHAGESGHRSVWYRWRAPATPGLLRLNTVGSTFDTLLAVYTGDRVEKLTEIGSDDDRGGFFTSALEVGVQPGLDYAIALDGFGNFAGQFVLTWTFHPLPDPVPRIVSHPRSTTLAEGATTTLSVIAEGLDLRYQWHFQGTPLPGATSRELPLSRFQDAMIGDYFVSVQSGSGPLAWSRRATVEIGSDPNVWSVDKVSFGATPPPPGLRKQGPGGSLWSLAAGSFLYQQRLNTSLTTVSLGEADPNGAIANATRWIGLRALQNGWLVVDTRGSQIDSSVLLYESPERWPIPSVIHETVNGHPRWRAWARANEEYWVSLDGRNAAQGIVYVNVQLGDLPDPPDETEPTTLAPALGETLRLPVPTWVRSLQPSATLHWLFNGQPIGDWTTNDWIVDAIAESHQGQYELVVSNAFGWIGTPVASVQVEVPLQLPPAATGLAQGAFTFQLRGNPGQSYELLSTDSWRAWSTETQGWFGPAPVTYRDPQTGQRPQRFFLLRQRALAVGQTVRLGDGRLDVTVQGGKSGQRYVLERSLDLAQWEPVATNTVRGADWRHTTPPAPATPPTQFRVRPLP